MGIIGIRLPADAAGKQHYSEAWHKLCPRDGQPANVCQVPASQNADVFICMCVRVCGGVVIRDFPTPKTDEMCVRWHRVHSPTSVACS
jgi:hypothetical protein